jgi:hypothetical protein
MLGLFYCLLEKVGQKMSANLEVRNYLNFKGIKVGDKVDQETLLELIDFVPSLKPMLPQTPDEVLSGKNYISGTIKDSGDYSKSIAVVSDKLTAKEGDPYIVEELVSPSASIGLAQILQDGKKKYVIVFKNKANSVGFACIGGTVGLINPNTLTLSQIERSQIFTEALSREFLEEAGLNVLDSKLIDAPILNARLNHACAFYLVKATKVGGQRLEDADLSILVSDFETIIKALTCFLAIDDFIVKYLKFYLKEIKEYFEE